MDLIFLIHLNRRSNHFLLLHDFRGCRLSWRIDGGFIALHRGSLRRRSPWRPRLVLQELSRKKARLQQPVCHVFFSFCFVLLFHCSNRISARPVIWLLSNSFEQ
uniref:(northern house mosquito) hypothetical protein n=1 Tax=Culex pipiens TaxID=7175 RepID=A0A8D8HB61_CULPI